MTSKLPEWCYGYDGDRQCVVVIKRGHKGYWKALDPFIDHDVENAKMGVTVPQAFAMMAGSMYGFDDPLADPDAHRTFVN